MQGDVSRMGVMSHGELAIRLTEARQVGDQDAIDEIIEQFEKERT